MLAGNTVGGVGRGVGLGIPLDFAREGTAVELWGIDVGVKVMGWEEGVKVLGAVEETCGTEVRGGVVGGMLLGPRFPERGTIMSTRSRLPEYDTLEVA